MTPIPAASSVWGRLTCESSAGFVVFKPHIKKNRDIRLQSILMEAAFRPPSEPALRLSTKYFGKECPSYTLRQSTSFPISGTEMRPLTASKDPQHHQTSSVLKKDVLMRDPQHHSPLPVRRKKQRKTERPSLTMRLAGQRDTARL